MRGDHTVQKNSREEIRIVADNFKGFDIINIRVWYRDQSGEMRPGKHGLAFRRDLLPQIIEALTQAGKGGAA